MSERREDESSQSVSSQRLRRALEEMTKAGAKLTASALCEKAHISRNALYRYHPQVVDELRELQDRHRIKSGASDPEVERLKTENETLIRQVGQLASLVDHYFAAWKDAEASSKRRENELYRLRKQSIVPLRSSIDDG